jgi:drug/metabolite transporter (DMT)-like permease
MAFGQASTAAFILLPVTMVVDQPFGLPVPSLGGILALISLATFSTALAYLLYFRLIAEAGATNASLVTLLIPVVATSLGVGFLGEIFEPAHGIGLMLIAFGLMLIDGRIGGQRRRIRAEAVPPEGR